MTKTLPPLVSIVLDRTMAEDCRTLVVNVFERTTGDILPLAIASKGGLGLVSVRIFRVVGVSIVNECKEL